MYRNRNNTSRATPTTLCQKCLKRGHYSYECTSSVQERPYVARASRTRQLANPNLRPKLDDSVPEEFTNRINDSRLSRDRDNYSAQKPVYNSKKHGTNSNKSEDRQERQRSRSYSSVSSFSTNSSHSQHKSRPDVVRSRSRSSSKSNIRSGSLHRSERRKLRETINLGVNGERADRPSSPEIRHSRKRRRADSRSRNMWKPDFERVACRRRPSPPSVQSGRPVQSHVEHQKESNPQPDSDFFPKNDSSRLDERRGHDNSASSKNYGRDAADDDSLRRERDLSPYSKRLLLTQSL